MSLEHYGVYSTYYLNKNNIDAFSRTINTLQRDCKVIRARQNKNRKNDEKNEKLRTSKNLYRVEKKEIVLNSDSLLFSNEETNSALKISTEYLINKQKELQSVQSIKSVDGNKLVMTRNEQRKLNQNSIAEKVEAMNQKEIDHQLTASLTSIKREKSLILDKYLELEAIKFYYSKKNIPSSLKSNKTRVIKSAPAEDMHTSEDGVPVNIEFLNKDYANLQNKLTDFYGKKYELLPARQKMSAPASFRSYMDSIRDKFREQNSRYFPNYKKKSKDLKISLTYDDLVKDLGKLIHNFNR
jgi:hypothetical protein